MRRLSAIRFAASLALMLAAWAPAHAAFVSWSYNWSRVPADVVSADSNGTSRISLTEEPSGRATNSSDIIATNLQTFSTASRDTPNNFKDAAYTLTLRLTDDASGESGTLTFNGAFSGTLSSSSADISSAFTSPTTGSLTLGGNEYLVTVGDYSPPGPPGISNAGSIGATVEVRAASDAPPPDDPGPVTDTPEPSTILLSCLGLSSLGLAAWRTWKRDRRGRSRPGMSLA